MIRRPFLHAFIVTSCCLSIALPGLAHARKKKHLQALQYTFSKKKKGTIQLPKRRSIKPLSRRTKKAEQKAISVGAISPYSAPFVMSKKVQRAYLVNERKRARLRIGKMKLLLSLISSLSVVVPSDKEKRGELLHQLSEEYREHAKFLYFQEMVRHHEAMERWDRAYRKVRAGRRPPAPKPNLEKSRAYKVQAIRVYKKLIDHFKRYSRLDEVTFSAALEALSLNQKDLAQTFFKILLKRHPKSRYIADAQMAFGDMHFGENRVTDASIHYSHAIKAAMFRIKLSHTTPATKMSMRGIHVRSLFMLAWCMFNAGDYPRSIRLFRRVVRLSMIYKRTKQSKILLHKEALRDMVRVFAKMGKSAVKKAYSYFRRTVGPKAAFKVTTKLAHRLRKEGHFLASIQAFRLLLRTSPTGHPNALHQNVPILQMNLIQAAQRIWTPTRMYAEVETLAKMLSEKSIWSKRWGQKLIGKQLRAKLEQKWMTLAVSYHQLAQSEEKKRPKFAESCYQFSIQLYRTYLLRFPRAESANELRFFLAELLYRKAENSLKKKARRHEKKARESFARAAYHYQRVATWKKRGNPHAKQAQFAEILCLEQMIGATKRLRIQPQRINTKWLSQKRGGVLTWKRRVIRKGSLDSRLLSAYRRYLRVVTNKDEKLETYFKIGVLYYRYRHYLKSIDLFASMVTEFPQHQLSRRAAFMVLYGYQDLKQWEKLEGMTRFYLRNRLLVRDKTFRTEMYQMLVRAAYLPHYKRVRAMGKKSVPLRLMKRFVRYEKEFGVRGIWKKRGFTASPRAAHALALAAHLFVRQKRLLKAIMLRERLVRLYPHHALVPDSLLILGRYYEQIANYDQAASWFERYIAFRSPKILLPSAQNRQKRKVLVTKKKKSSKFRHKMATALFKAASFRRGLGHWKRSVQLYQKFVALFPKDKDALAILLVIAQIQERMRQWQPAILAYQHYIRRYQPKVVTEYLKQSVKWMKKRLPRHGLLTSLTGIHQKASKRQPNHPFLLKKLGQLPLSALKQSAGTLYAMNRMARCYGQMGQVSEQETEWMKVDALGFQMYLNRHPDMRLGKPARGVFSEARFSLVERQRKRFVALSFGSNWRHNRKVMKQMIQVGQRLARDYREVARLQDSKWVLAAVFRMGEISQLFSKKLLTAPIPTNLPAADVEKYKQFLQQRAMRYEDSALDIYNRVVQKSAALGVYNFWVQRCEGARDKLMRRNKRINPYTIFRNRNKTFWLVEKPAKILRPSRSYHPIHRIPVRRP